MARSFTTFRVRGWALAAATVLLAACGSDATGPTGTTVDASAALSSLALGERSLTGSGAVDPAAISFLPALNATASLVTAADVQVNGTPVHMFALAGRMVYPAGTCLNQLLGGSSLPGPCITPPGGLLLILWQSSSATQPPDRLAVVMADVGQASFGDPFSDGSGFTSSTTIPPIALYSEKGTSVWTANGGAITTTVTPGSATCTLPPPAFAKTATCATASFATSGTINLESINFSGTGAAGAPVTITIPAQTLNGVIQTITAVQPIPLPAP